MRKRLLGVAAFLLLWFLGAEASAQVCDVYSPFVCTPEPFTNWPQVPPPGGGTPPPPRMNWVTTNPGIEVARWFASEFNRLKPFTPQVSREFESVPGWSDAPEDYAQSFLETVEVETTVDASGITATPSFAPPEVARNTGPYRHLQIPLSRPLRVPDANLGHDPVDLASGAMIYRQTDLAFPGFGVTYAHRRTYSSRWSYDGPQGVAWDHFL